METVSSAPPPVESIADYLDPTQWAQIVDESAFHSCAAIARHYGLCPKSLRKWVSPWGGQRRQPNAANFEKVSSIMRDLKKDKGIRYHPSYGYATEEQIKQLTELPIGHERDYIMKQVVQQTADRGKRRK